MLFTMILNSTKFDFIRYKRKVNHKENMNRSRGYVLQ